MNETDCRLLHNLQFASSPQGHGLVDVGIKPEELYSYDTGKPHGVIINETEGGGHWQTGETKIPNEPGIFVPAIAYDEQYQGQLMKLNERVGARGHFWATVNKVILPTPPQTGKTPTPPQKDNTPPQKGGNQPPAKGGNQPPAKGGNQPPENGDNQPSLININRGIGEPVGDAMNPEYSDGALTVEFGPSYENKKSQKPVTGFFTKMIRKIKGNNK